MADQLWLRTRIREEEDQFVMLKTEAIPYCLYCVLYFTDVCQVLAKSMTHSCRIGILLTRVKLVLTPGVPLGNHINDA